MADTVLTRLVGILSVDSTEYEAGLSKAQTALNNVKKVAAVAFAAATAAAGAFVKASVDTGMEFEKSMSQVAATMGVTSDEIEDLSKFAQHMGETTAFSAIQASEALNYMALAGYDAEKSMSMLPAVLDLAASGNIDLARASDMVTDAESALSLEGNQVNNMINQMAKAASKSNTSVEQLGDAILTIGGTATLMSGGTERLTTVLGILADNGIKGSEAGTHLRNMLLKLSAPTNDGAKAIKELGLNVFDADGKMRDMQDIITDLNVAMADLTDEQKIKYISTLFNARDVAAVNALLNTTTDRWNELGAAIEDSEGAASKMAETMLDNLAGSLTLFRSKMEGVRITIYKNLEPALRRAIDNISNIVDKVNWNSFGQMIGRLLDSVVKGLNWVANNADKLLVVIKSLGVAFVTFKVASFTASMVSVVSSIASAVKAGGGFVTVIGKMTAALNANPFVLAATALAGLVTAIVLVRQKAEELDPSIVALQESTKSFIDTINQETEAYSQAQQARDSLVTSAESEMTYYESLLEELNGIVDANGNVKQGYEERAQIITGILSDAFGIEIENNGKVIKGYQKIQEEVKKTIAAKQAEAKLQASEQAWKEALQKREEAVKKLQDAHEKLTEIMGIENEKRGEYANASEEYNKLFAQWDGYSTDIELENVAKRMEEAAKEYNTIKGQKDDLQASYDSLAETVSGYSYDIAMYERNVGLAAEGAYDKIAYISPQLAKELAGMTEEQRKQYEESIGYSTQFAMDVYNESVKVGENMTKGFSAGSSNPSLVKSFKNGVMSIARQALNAAKYELGIQSPSKEMAKVGRFFVEGFTEGIEDKERSVIRQVSDLSKTAVDAFDGSVSYEMFANGNVSMMKSNSANGDTTSRSSAPISITVQSVLNGKIIGEDTYQYIKGRLKVGGALV